MKDISNSADIIDSRDIIERIEELEGMREPFTAGCNMAGYMPDSEPATFADFEDARVYIVDMLRERADEEEESASDDNNGDENAGDLRVAADELADADGCFSVTVNGVAYWVTDSDREGLDEDDAEELKTLRALASEAEGYGDWSHGEALIRDDYFEEYAQQFADDIGAINSDASWPNNCIDWERAARELQMDYTSVDYGGVTYWMRS